MATIGSVGSGIDPASMAAQLAAAERAPADARLGRTETTIKAQVSAIGTLRSAMASLQAALRTLSGTQSTQARSVGLPATAGFSAIASPGAPVGQYQVEVLALASAHKLASPAFTNGDTAVGTGRLSIAAGTHAFDVDIVDGETSLLDIRDAINAAAAGKGVQASIVNGDAGSRLVLTSLDSGTANAITVTPNGGDGGLAALAWPGGSGMEQIAAPADASLKVDGIVRTSPGNTITDLLPGVSFTLKAAAPGTVVEMTVGNDPASQLAAVKTFVAGYNAALAAITSTTSYNAGTKVAAALNGDAMVRGMSRELRDLVGGDVTALKAMGISIAKDGVLSLNEATFTAAATRDPDTLANVFGSGADRLGGKLSATMTSLLAADGPLKSRDDGLAQRTRQLSDQRSALDRRMTLVEARYKAQFLALDAMVTKLQSTSSFLSQQLSSSTTS